LTHTDIGLAIDDFHARRKKTIYMEKGEPYPVL
jgi:hypothetical protein